MQARNKRERTAYHEAGHVISAVQLGVPVISATIDRKQPHFLRGRYKQSRDLAIEHLVTVCLAGPAAEEMFCGPITDDGDAVDLRMARSYLAPHYSEFVLGFQIDRLRGAAERLVRDTKPKIKLIADALLKHGSLDADQISALVTRAPGIRPAAPHEYATHS
jgi:ATP-dependent Zn protease